MMASFRSGNMLKLLNKQTHLENMLMHLVSCLIKHKGVMGDAMFTSFDINMRVLSVAVLNWNPWLAAGIRRSSDSLISIIFIENISFPDMIPIKFVFSTTKPVDVVEMPWGFFLRLIHLNKVSLSVIPAHMHCSFWDQTEIWHCAAEGKEYIPHTQSLTCTQQRKCPNSSFLQIEVRRLGGFGLSIGWTWKWFLINGLISFSVWIASTMKLKSGFTFWIFYFLSFHFLSFELFLNVVAMILRNVLFIFYGFITFLEMFFKYSYLNITYFSRLNVFFKTKNIN